MDVSELFAIMPAYTVALMVVVGVLGAVFGSFINCVAWRLVAGESPWKGRSHCDTCGHVLGVPDLVPIFSWLFLRGKCRYCGAKVSVSCLVTELMLAVYFVSVVLVYGLTLRALVLLVVGCCLLGLSLVDLQTFIIPNGFVLVIIGAWVVLVGGQAAMGEAWMQTLTDGLLGGVIIAGVVWALSAVMERVLQRPAMGFGDIKLLFAVGLFLGPAVGLLNLIVACVVGIVFGLAGPRPDASLLDDDEDAEADDVEEADSTGEPAAKSEEAGASDEPAASSEQAEAGAADTAAATESDAAAAADAAAATEAAEADANDSADDPAASSEQTDAAPATESDSADESIARQPFPFGPSIALATWFSFVFGSQIVSWYLGLFM